MQAPPEAPEEFGQWAQSLVELAEQKGFVAGEQKGEAKGEAKSLLLVLRARGIAVPPELEQRILGCPDPGVLLTWLQRAATASTAAEVLEDEQAVAS